MSVNFFRYLMILTRTRRRTRKKGFFPFPLTGHDWKEKGVSVYPVFGINGPDHLVLFDIKPICFLNDFLIYESLYKSNRYFECGTHYKLHSQVSICLKILDAGQEIAFFVCRIILLLQKLTTRYLSNKNCTSFVLILASTHKN